jgi:hypothetical protein
MSFGRVEDTLCWLGSVTGVGSALANAVILDISMKVLVFVIMAISCVACGAWAYKTKNKPFLLAEMVYFGIAVLGIATHMGYLGSLI